VTSVIIEDADEPNPGGVRPIRTIQRRAARPVPAPSFQRSAAALAGLLLAVLATAVAVAPSAAAIDDPTHPDARVTHGPSCRPGGLVVEVVAGAAPYAVRLATTRTPAGEDEAVLAPGETVVLSTGDVAPGETIDARLEFTAQDGSGETYVDDLEDWTLTRPTVEDCEAAASPPPVPEPPADPTSPSSPSSPSTPAPTQTPRPTPSAEPTPTPAPSSPSTSAPSSLPPASPTRQPPAGSRPPTPQAGENRAAGDAVPAGGTVDLRMGGFVPGEQVTITLQSTGERLASATADDDGSIAARVRIPVGTAPGPVSLGVQGDSSAVVTDVPLQVAGAVTEAPGGTTGVVPLLAAGALAATGLATLAATSRRRSGRS
jgi:hypothetical protein